MTLFDINVSFGVWPFQQFPFSSLDSLAQHLAGAGITHALVSHLGAVFHADPAPFNQALFDEAEESGGILRVPVVNPAFPGWRKMLDRYFADGRTPALKIYPTYHNYTLDSEIGYALASYLALHPALLLVHMRLEDERTQYHALHLEGLPVDDIVAFHRQFPDLDVICLNAYLPEARTIGRETARVGVDLSFAEWHQTVPLLLQDVPPNRIFFGSHTPFLYTRANILKLKHAPIDTAIKNQIARQNILDLLTD